MKQILHKITSSRISAPHLAWIFGITALLLTLYAAAATFDYRETQSRWNQAVQTAYDQSRTPGRACGVLSPRKSVHFIGEGLVQQPSVVPAYLLRSDPKTTELIVDGCRYTSKTNANIYAELIIKTYADAETAEKAFDDDIPVGGEIIWKEAKDNGEKLFYDSGVHYLLMGNEIITVAASNGNPGATETFSTKIFEQLYPEIKR